MKTVLHLAAERKKVNFGWLNSYHSFSFGNYYDANKTNFGALRVLNDDTVKGGTGFGKHPRDNMEIISISFKGALQHEDTTGTKAIIWENDVHNGYPHRRLIIEFFLNNKNYTNGNLQN